MILGDTCYRSRLFFFILYLAYIIVNWSMKKIGLVFGIVVLIYSCKKDKSEELITEVGDTSGQSYCDTVTVSFSNQVKPIFIQNCATSGCHDASIAGTYQFETYIQISNTSHIEPALKAMKHNTNSSPMPKFQPKLNDSLIGQIECWISQGKQNN